MTDTERRDERTDETAPAETDSSSSAVDNSGRQQETEVKTDPASDADQRAASFLDLEADLTRPDKRSANEPKYGLATDADRIAAAEIPQAYPWQVDTESAVALTLEYGQGEQTAYFAWPPPDGGRLDRLLAVADIDSGEFAQLYGTQVRLTTREGTVVPMIPDTVPRGSPDGRLAVVGGLAFNLLTLLGVVLGVSAVSTLWFLTVFLTVNLLVIPAGTAVDARYLRSQTDWNQAPLLWAFGSALPFVNIPVSLLYLRSRRAVSPLSR